MPPMKTVRGGKPGDIHMTVLWPASPSVGVEKAEKQEYTLTDLDMAEFSANFVKMLGGKVLDIHQH